MLQDWADKIAHQLVSQSLIQTGICLILGAADTGKTTLAAALAKHTASSQPVGIVDADIGQSHIGPPTTVGWALVEPDASGQGDFSQLAVGGISFVGDITPVGHLLQLTAAITQCTHRVSRLAELIIIDTPGLVSGPAAVALWWTVQRISQPKLILAVQRDDELSDILTGLQSLDLRLELIKSPPEIPNKSPRVRQSYRQNQFNRYFENSFLYNIDISDIAVQAGRSLNRRNLVSRLVGLRDEEGTDMAIGIVTDWQQGGNTVVIKAPRLDIQKIRCLVIGDVSIETH